MKYYKYIILLLIIHSCKSNKYFNNSAPKNKSYKTNIGLPNTVDTSDIPGLNVSIDSVKSLFNQYKEELSDLGFGTLNNFGYDKVVNGKTLWNSRGFTRGLSILAQLGDKEIENYLLNNFSKYYTRHFIDNNQSLSRYFFHHSGDIEFQAFNRIPPSKEKVQLLLKLYGRNSECQSYEPYGYVNADLLIGQYILLNYDKFYQYNRYTINLSDPYFLENLKNLENNNKTPCLFYKRISDDLIKEVSNMKFNELVSQEKWAKYEVPRYSFF